VKTAAIIPAFDAENTIERVVRETVERFRGLGTVYVVDDGSRDKTQTLAENAGAVCLSHPHNRGKGAALRTGFLRAWEDGHDACVTLDADGQHPPAEALRLAQSELGRDSLVLGIRDLRGAGAPRPNQISNQISNSFLSLFSRRLLRDTQCGLRRYPLPAVLELGGQDMGYAFEAEVILLAVAARIPINELPIEVLYPHDRTTHFDSVKDPMRVIRRVLSTLRKTHMISRPSGDARPILHRQEHADG
jgi:glycosyltransferase involved in cell wall biosynthesis